MGGKTESYPLFLKIKKVLAKRLYLNHPTLIKIQILKKQRVSPTMIDVDSYRYVVYLILE